MLNMWSGGYYVVLFAVLSLKGDVTLRRVCFVSLPLPKPNPSAPPLLPHLGAVGSQPLRDDAVLPDRLPNVINDLYFLWLHNNPICIYLLDLSFLTLNKRVAVRVQC